jgi:nucleoid-associated protein YgaU
MQKDFKTGMAVGLVLAIVVLIGLSTRPGLSIKARVSKPDSAINRKIETPEMRIDGIGSPKGVVADRSQPEQVANEQIKETKPSERIHIVRSGETLSDISRQYYGSADKWQKILGADRLPISAPSKLRPGMKLIIPE